MGKRQSLGKTIWKHRASYLLMAPYFILFFFFTVLPVLMAIGVSFTDWNMLEKPEFVGWQNYVKLLLDDEIFIISLKNTLIFAVITGPVSYMLCLLFAWIINEFNRGMRTLLTLIFYAPSICGNAYMVWNLILTRRPLRLFERYPAEPRYHQRADSVDEDRAVRYADADYRSAVAEPGHRLPVLHRRLADGGQEHVRSRRH